jgi:hypothetical protein
VDAADLTLRKETYRLFAALGRAPTPDELGLPEDVLAGWRRLHDEHALVLDAKGALRMANPFAAVETPYRVEAGGRSWYGNCAWDAFGILAALHVDGRIETSCADCGEPIVVDVRDEQPDDETLLFHCLVPAARWWDDIVFT